ncbi:uncharacterized protein Bfra_012253 [Botrytis fragariae]|uniref:Ecp2 effector protein domain-containing protein n=1 Tax=Botrytis fragariae TaxID=1964551 RepID=A0A8H6EDY2_9HELO|nr:uncharacterized protein Bfra_012253 [Botrytis fragariae]KAF5868606.1 hypothetical protein Bfra_012253 [Botrytis fragariae]
MRFTTPTISILLSGFFSSLAIADSSTCSSICAHNNDPGLWTDAHVPSAQVDSILTNGGGCVKGSVQGHMCIAIIGSEEDASTVAGCLEQMAAQWQSYTDNWYLWSSITCASESSTGIISITA